METIKHIEVEVQATKPKYPFELLRAVAPFPAGDKPKDTDWVVRLALLAPVPN